MTDTTLSRRGLFLGALALGGTMLIESPLLAAIPEKRLAFRNVHTNDKVDARFFANGRFDPQGLAELNHGLRDWRTGDTTNMDPDLFSLLAEVRDRLEVDPRKSFDLISGYRTPKTNASLRAKGGAHTGVASTSQHMLGKATDIALPGIALDRVRLAALSVKRGGVGYYPHDGFVHVDTGRVRTW
jgi:uncharacterized protein YcbK (DUF882 family)